MIRLAFSAAVVSAVFSLPARAALLAIDPNDPDARLLLRQSYFEYFLCSRNPDFPEQLCFKLLLDPKVVSGDFTISLPEDRVDPNFVPTVNDVQLLNGFELTDVIRRADGNGQVFFEFSVARDESDLCGDFDRDGDVDAADRTTQTRSWTGAGAAGQFNKTFAEGDCDGDGDVDVADQTGLVQNWTGARGGEILLLEVPDANPNQGTAVMARFDGSNVAVIAGDGSRIDDVPVTGFETTIDIFRVPLTTEQEVPQPDVDGFSPTGEAWVTVDNVLGRIGINGRYSDMTSEVTAAHLHGFASQGEAADVLFPLEVTGGTEGFFEGRGALENELDLFLEGLTYINVHTENNPPGEIRGQVENLVVPLVVPEPAALTLLLVSLCGFLAFARRR